MVGAGASRGLQKARVRRPQEGPKSHTQEKLAVQEKDALGGTFSPVCLVSCVSFCPRETAKTAQHTGKNRTCANVCLASGPSFLLAHQLFLCVALAVFLGPHQGPLGAASGLGIVSSRDDDLHGHGYSTTLKGQKNTRTQDMHLKLIFDFEGGSCPYEHPGLRL